MTRAAARAALLAALSVWPQAPAPSTPAKTIDVHAWVENDNGLPASTMSPADFELLVDGALVPIQQIAPRARGTSIVVLIDTSRSVTWDREVLERHVSEFAAALGPGDRTSIATFGARASVPPFKAAQRDVRGELRLALERREQEGYGSSPVWDAIYEAVTVLAREPGARAILLLTDGRATGNRYGLSQVADYAMTNGVCISAVLKHSSQWISQGGGTAALVQPGAPIQGLAAFTGGMYFTYPESQDDQARAVFKRVASTLMATHVFSFIPPQFDGLPHRLVIRPIRQYVDVHAPLGFVAR
jgi:von Willebrand factor type A domain-containing protein